MSSCMVVTIVHIGAYVVKHWSQTDGSKHGPISKILKFFSISFSKRIWKCRVPCKYLNFEILNNPKKVKMFPKWYSISLYYKGRQNCQLSKFFDTPKLSILLHKLTDLGVAKILKSGSFDSIWGSKPSFSGLQILFYAASCKYFCMVG